jgi:hypothetical protein
VDGGGGERALERLSSFQLRSTGRTFSFDEGLRPGDTVTPASTFTLTLNYDLRDGGDRLRADYVRTSQDTARRVSEITSGRLGYISGVDSNGGSPTTTAMTSDRWAAVTREQRLLNPHVILRDAVARPRLASTAPSRTINGRPHGSSSSTTTSPRSACTSTAAPGASTASPPRTTPRTAATCGSSSTTPAGAAPAAASASRAPCR